MQITAAETVGVEDRGKYYEEAGVVRDMFQNHLLQLLSLTAMEPPAQMSADAVRDEKVKVLRVDAAVHAARRCTTTRYARSTPPGRSAESRSPAIGRSRMSRRLATPTYAAPCASCRQLALEGRAVLSAVRQAHAETGVGDRGPVPDAAASHVPRSRKPDDRTQYAASACSPRRAFRSVRGEGARRRVTIDMASVDMDFSYAEAFGELDHAAYETLLLDCMIGEATLFTRADEVEAAWRWSIPSSTSGRTSGPTTSPTMPQARGGRLWPTSSSRARARNGGSRND